MAQFSNFSPRRQEQKKVKITFKIEPTAENGEKNARKKITYKTDEENLL